MAASLRCQSASVQASRGQQEIGPDRQFALVAEQVGVLPGRNVQRWHAVEGGGLGRREQAACECAVIRVGDLGMDAEDQARLMTTDATYQRCAGVVIIGDETIWQCEVLTGLEAEDTAGLSRFRSACLWGPTAAHLAAGGIDYDDRGAETRLLGDGGTDLDLGIVGMRRDDQDVATHAMRGMLGGVVEAQAELGLTFQAAVPGGWKSCGSWAVLAST